MLTSGMMLLALLSQLMFYGGLISPSFVSGSPAPSRRANAPYFDGGVEASQAAVFWFGRVTPTENYADVRVGYNDDHLYLQVEIMDRRLWYDPAHSRARLTSWDAVSLYLNLSGNQGNAPNTSTYDFVGQLTWWEQPRDAWQAVYRGDGTRWSEIDRVFTTEAGWQGDVPNSNYDDRGWVLTYAIPFASLGLSASPSSQTVWGMALALHDRDDAAGTPIPDTTWPEEMDPDVPATWGQLVFGLPVFSPPPAIHQQTVTIRQGLNGVSVPDGAVGGNTNCGEGLDYWSQWGQANYSGADRFNVQNQADVSDWPCFSKYYVSFPLTSLPAGQVIVSAIITLHQIGNAGEGWDPPPEPSYIQVLTVHEDWDEDTLTWNNAPLAAENMAAAWVNPVSEFPGWPGLPRQWDISRAAANAYLSGAPLRLAVYSADTARHSGRYFTSSDAEDWDQVGRPTLTLLVGQPTGPQLTQIVQPGATTRGHEVAYRLTLVGTGSRLTLTDSLPPEISAPRSIEASAGPTPNYDPASHRLSWSDTPAAGKPVTISFSATVQVSGPRVIYNTASLTDAGQSTIRKTSSLIVDGFQGWMPMISR